MAVAVAFGQSVDGAVCFAGQPVGVGEIDDARAAREQAGRVRVREFVIAGQERRRRRRRRARAPCLRDRSVCVIARQRREQIAHARAGRTAALERRDVDVGMRVEQADEFGRGVAAGADDVNRRHASCSVKRAISLMVWAIDSATAAGFGRAGGPLAVDRSARVDGRLRHAQRERVARVERRGLRFRRAARVRRRRGARRAPSCRSRSPRRLNRWRPCSRRRPARSSRFR